MSTNAVPGESVGLSSGMVVEGLTESITLDSSVMYEHLKGITLTVRAGDVCVTKSFGELGIVVRDEAVFLQDYKKVLLDPGSREVVRGIELNSYGVRGLVEELASIFNRSATEPVFLGVKNDTPCFRNGKSGEAIDVDRTVSLVQGAMKRFTGNNVVVDALVFECLPTLSDEAVDACSSVVGEYFVPCDFETASGMNALRAMELINGSVVYPGEEFSSREALMPFVEENGYVSSTGFMDGFVVDSIGGGVCRVVTALYGATLYTNVEVVERHNHTKQVSYVQAAMDATVSSEKDFVIKNNTRSPLIIVAEPVENAVRIALIGEPDKELEGCTIKLDVKVTDIVLQGADEVVVSEELPFMEYMIVEPGASGCKAVLYRYVYDADGFLQSYEKVNESFYLPRSNLVVAGMYYAQ